LREQGSNGARGAAWPWLSWLGGLLISLLLVGGLSAACAGKTADGSNADAQLAGGDSLVQAYRAAHPHLIDGPLIPVKAACADIVAAIEKDLDPGGEIWLPTYLPAGFSLAAPYNGTGAGSAYPNPYVWGRGYCITYTDGRGYILVIFNSDDDLSGGNWEGLPQTLAGRQLRLQENSEIVLVVAEADGRPPILICGGGLARVQLRVEVIKTATGLMRVR